MRSFNWFAILAVFGCCTTATCQTVSVDSQLPSYKKVSGIAGGSMLKTVGSDTMNNMVGLWTEEFKKLYPGVKTAVDGKGSSNAIPALTERQATFGPMSRDAKKSEITAFSEKFGYPPLLIPTAIDMLAVYVNKDNPLEGLSFPEIDSIFSSTRKQGAKQQAVKWGEFLKQPAWSSKSIACYGRNASSGTYGYFKEMVLADGDYGTWVGEAPGSSSVVQSVGENLYGIGYSGIGYRTANVKPLKLSVELGGALVAPEPANAFDGSYPLARFLYLAVNYDPRGKLDPLQTEFLKFVLSKPGQEQVIKDGYLPVSADIAREALLSVGVEPGF